ncbi:MAG: histone deacetylase [Candidatus Riflebacteria bacterium]|nr:histone deacetylase [Candidatus Riflebacteria bacterium]
MELSPTAGVILFHPDMLLHDPLTATIEGGRLALITEQLVLDGLWGHQIVEADIATMKRLRDIHEENYLNELHRKSTHGVSQLDARTPLMEKSFEIARFSAGGVLDAIDLVMNEEVPTALCLTATPGHHAGVRSWCGGSLLNYAAVGAHYLTKKFQQKRVAIIDLDAAHGNGTQEIFWRRRDVLYLSMHEYPAFPGSGHYSDMGEPPAAGYTVNLPLPSAYGDREYLACWQELAMPILRQFEPEFILLSWGTNVLKCDANFHLIVSESGLLALMKEVIAAARELCKGHLISILEGGTPGKAMARAVSQHAMLLLNNHLVSVDREEKGELVSYVDWYSYAKLLKSQYRKYWRV